LNVILSPKYQSNESGRHHRNSVFSASEDYVTANVEFRIVALHSTRSYSIKRQFSFDNNSPMYRSIDRFVLWLHFIPTHEFRTQ